jgi:hypothetical protein
VPRLPLRGSVLTLAMARVKHRKLGGSKTVVQGDRREGASCQYYRMARN